ncbi:MAG: tRNA (adenosine(37)-N6)-threonylcarbamoyltransferase complex ATPase subunit type 1 TsaE [Pseudomonadota bacterium]
MSEPFLERIMTEPAMAVLAQLLARRVVAGDVVALEGDLGAGKSTFARALIRAYLTNPEAEVPSPSFPILLTYDADASRDAQSTPIAHYDWYRLSDPSELDEIGFVDLRATHISLVEWPNRFPGVIDDAHLHIAIASAPARPDARHVTMTYVGAPEPPQRLARLAALDACVAGLADDPTNDLIVCADHMSGDASSRAYTRLTTRDGHTLVLVDSPPMPDGAPLADGRPYSHYAKLAETLTPFLTVAEGLNAAGISAPRVVHAHEGDGTAILEDLGNTPFDHAVRAGTHDQARLWMAAVDTLVHLRQHVTEAAMLPSWIASRPSLDLDVLCIELSLLTDWAFAAENGAAPRDAVRAKFFSEWVAELSWYVRDDAETGVMLRDVHSPNLMWLPDRDGHRRVGVIDFQDALQGPWAYDLVSLLQDARVDVDPALERAAFDHYCARIADIDPKFDRSAFERDYAVLGAQRACKIIGIFHRLKARDGKPGYMQHLPRVARALKQNLEHPALAQVAGWFGGYMPAYAPDSFRTR